jgi:dihydroorotate dehydrogenase
MHPALYKNLIRPILFRLDAEEAHLLIHRWIGQCRPLWAMAGKALTYKGDDLECALFGHKLSNPIGLAAGFDKNADLVEFIGHLGFRDGPG